MVALRTTWVPAKLTVLGRIVLRCGSADRSEGQTPWREAAGAGDLTRPAGVQELYERCRRRLRSRCRCLVVDLSEVSQVDTKLVASLVVLKRYAHSTGQRVEVRYSEPVRAWLRVCRLDGVLDGQAA
jgi:ABC-type transporter Mla MlaB component